jgi:hypothetical protein
MLIALCLQGGRSLSPKRPLFVFKTAALCLQNGCLALKVAAFLPFFSSFFFHHFLLKAILQQWWPQCHNGDCFMPSRLPLFVSKMAALP